MHPLTLNCTQGRQASLFDIGSQKFDYKPNTISNVATPTLPQFPPGAESLRLHPRRTPTTAPQDPLGHQRHGRRKLPPAPPHLPPYATKAHTNRYRPLLHPACLPRRRALNRERETVRRRIQAARAAVGNAARGSPRSHQEARRLEGHLQRELTVGGCTGVYGKLGIYVCFPVL